MSDRAWMVFGLSGVLLAGMTARADERSTTNDERLIVSHAREFKIPFAIDPAIRDRAGQVTLFVSTDEGKTWRVAAKGPAAEEAIPFSAPEDGIYWFAVRVAIQGEETEPEGSKLSPSLKVKFETTDRAGEGSREQGLNDRLEETKLNVELLNLELETEKNQLRQQLQVLKQYEFGFGGMGGMGMGGFGVGARNSEEGKKALASIREQYEGLRTATLETSKKLGRERRRLAELERMLKPPGPAGKEGRATDQRPDDPAELRAGLDLLELDYDVEKALLREAMMKLGRAELEGKTSEPASVKQAHHAAKQIEALRDYVKEKGDELTKRWTELNLKRRELAEGEKRLNGSK